MDDTKPKSNKGFASMTPERRKEIASKGGRSVPKEKRSFSRDKSLARAAGKKGGNNVKPQNRTFFKNRDLASAAGRAGGQAKAET
jgi:general stress protein YciG